MRKIFEIVNNICHAVFITSYRTCCGIFQDITKGFRNAFHLCGMTNGKDTNNCHTTLVTESKNIKRCRNKYGMTICRHSTLSNKTYIASYRMNEVNCGIIQDITKRFRNAFHLCGMTNVKKAIAFTLAETLIVMGIIGIVSALTLPNLNSSTGEKEKIAKVKKIYQNLDDALSRAHAIYGPQDEWYSGKTEAERNQIFFERVTEFMKVSKTCSPNTTGCMTKSQGNALNTGYSVTDTPQKFYQAILADGSSVSFFPYTDGICSENYCSTLYVDIDGPSKGSFTYGKDLFIFVGTNKEGLYQGWSLSTTEMAKCFKWGNTCSAWVMQTDNMDYLNTDVNGKCKNNSNLTLNLFASPAVTSCK